MLGKGKWESFSAGSKPAGYVHPMAIEVMQEIGVDLSANRSKHVEEFTGQSFDLVVTVCDSAKEACPVFPGAKQMLHWPFDDPAHATGSSDDVRNEFRRVRRRNCRSHSRLLFRGPYIDMTKLIHKTCRNDVSISSAAVSEMVYSPRKKVFLVSLAIMASTMAIGAEGLRAGEAPDRSQFIVATLNESGEAVLLRRDSLEVVRRFVPKQRPTSFRPMLVAEDRTRRLFYVGNFKGGIACIPQDGTEPFVIDMDGDVIGSAISSDGKLLAVNGAHDLRLRLVDLERKTVVSRTLLGNADDPPRHSHLTHGMASTHPIWLPDGSGVVTEDNIHEELILVDRAGKVRVRRSMPSAVHSLIVASKDQFLALAEGAVDGSVQPQVIVLKLPGLEIVRTMTVPLSADESAKLHHGALSPDLTCVVVANMGPMHGPGTGLSVACFRWNEGELVWRTETTANAGHVQYLSADQVVVLGHHASDLILLDAQSGKRTARWPVPGAKDLGHSLEAEPSGTVVVLNTTAGQVMRIGPKGVVAQSVPLGAGLAEASLAE